MEDESAAKYAVIDVVIPTKTLPPKENGIHHAQTVKQYAQQEKMSVSKPSHDDKGNPGSDRCKPQVTGYSSF
jgi:hypothetical protein